MIDYIKGDIVELSPAHLVVETGNIGYMLNISLITFAELQDKKNAKLYVYESIREDAHTLYGFLSKEERQLFMLLISVSGVGANTARVILSSVPSAELQTAIYNGDVALLKSVKGIGAKTAERIIVDLKDKVMSIATSDKGVAFSSADSSLVAESVSALVMLGFNQAMAQKVVKKVIDTDPTLKVELVVKQALKLL